MMKIETMWCELLFGSLEKRNPFFKQQELAEKLSMSLSTVNHGLKQLREMGAVLIGGNGGEVIDTEKVCMCHFIPRLEWLQKRL